MSIWYAIDRQINEVTIYRRIHICFVISHDENFVMIKCILQLIFYTKYSIAAKRNKAACKNHINCRSIIFNLAYLITQRATFRIIIFESWWNINIYIFLLWNIQKENWISIYRFVWIKLGLIFKRHFLNLLDFIITAISVDCDLCI